MRLKWWGWSVSVLIGAALLTGCGSSIPSSTVLLRQSVQQRQLDKAGLAAVKSALLLMKNVNSYQVKATINVATGRYTRTANFYGMIHLPGTVSMDETIGGSNYLVYQNGSFAYYDDQGKWIAMPSVQNLTPWTSLARLVEEDPPAKVYQLPQQIVVSWNCNVYQFTTMAKGKDFATLALDAGLHTIPHTALYTIWVDANDGQLRQVEVQSTMGVPNVGTTSVDATQLYFGYNQNVKISAPSDLVTQIEHP